MADIDLVEPAIVEPNESIRIRGAGFVEGLARATFTGLFKPAGLAAPERRTVHLTGRATSSSLIEIPVTGQTMQRLAREPTRFEGSLEVTFPTAMTLDAIQIVARRDDVSFDIRPTGGGLVLAAKRSRSAARFLRSLGLFPAESRHLNSILITRVASGSSADKAGVAAGDRLTAVDGTALVSLPSLDGIDRTSSHTYEFITANDAHRVVILSAAAEAALDSDEFTAIVLASIALGFFLAFAAPTRRFFDRPGGDLDNPLVKAVGLVAASIPLLIIPAGAMLSRAGFILPVALVCIHILGLCGLILSDLDKPLPRAIAFASHLLPVPVIIAVAGASGSAVGMWDVVASQAVTPWGWHAWSSPFALAAVFAALTLLWPALPGGGRPLKTVSVSTWIAAVPAACMLCTYCLGGWLIPGVPPERISENNGFLALGSVIFFAKTWLILLISRWLSRVDILERRATRESPRRLLVRLTLLMAAFTAALTWVWADLPDAYRVTGQILATSAFVTFFTSLTVAGLKGAGASNPSFR